MNTIENFKGGNIMELTKKDQFFIKHDKRVNVFLKDRNEFMSKLYNRVKELKKLMEKKQLDKCVSLWIHERRSLILDLKLSSHPIALDLSISPKGWKLYLYGRDNNSRSYLSKLLNTDPLKECKPDSIENSSYILKRLRCAPLFDPV